MNNKYTVGNDIVEVKRIKNLTAKYGPRFFRHVFTDQEVLWCNQRKNPAIHLSGRFAAKEAVKKALMAHGEAETIPFNTIEILRENGKSPTIEIHCKLIRSYHIQISISHTETLATAVAIAVVL